MTEFTPVSSALGGALIGLATSLLLLANGRVAGISGILAQAVWPGPGEARGWRWAFLVGLPLGAALVVWLQGSLALEIEASPGKLLIAGLLVGFGTRLGNGCTSGHGICGISRGSPRSLAATVTFMLIGGLTVLVTRAGLAGKL